jgi:hypothetical protein
MEAVILSLEKKLEAAKLEMEWKALMTERFKQMEEFMMMVIKKNSVSLENTTWNKDVFNVGEDMAESSFPYDPRENEIRTLRISEARSKEQIKFASQADIAAQPVQTKSVETGAVD